MNSNSSFCRWLTLSLQGVLLLRLPWIGSVAGPARWPLPAIGMGWLLASVLRAGAQFSSNYENIDIDNFQTNGAFVVGFVYSYDDLRILYGSVLVSPWGAIGVSGRDTNGVYRGIYNSALVDGKGSVWNNTNGNFVVGLSGAFNSLLVSGGGAVLSGSGSIGSDTASASNNTVLVTGAGSLWSNSAAGLTVGGYGSFNSIVISNGGKVFSRGGTLAAQIGSSNNAVLVTGWGSVWTNGFVNVLTLGSQGGGNSLTVANTGMVAAAVFVGDSGSGNSLVISNAGMVLGGDGVLGYGFGSSSNNSALVTDPGSTWNSGSYLYVGQDDPFNSLVISNGGAVFNRIGYIGSYSIAGTNSAWVTDRGSVWTNLNSLYVGIASSFNSLVITNGGTVCSGVGYVGSNVGASNNTALVTGDSSFWVNTNSLHIGESASFNSLVIGQGGTVSDQMGYLGYNSGASNNSVLVTDTDSTWTNSNDLVVGDFGSFNRLVISNGGRVFNGTGNLGLFGFRNSALVTDTNSLWTNNGDLSVGPGGFSNSLVISNGGTAIANQGYVGTVGQQNSALVTDAGSKWINFQSLEVGFAGFSNSLEISLGGMVFDRDGSVGSRVSAKKNNVLVTGSGSTWSNQSSVLIGDAGSFNTLVISNGGTVSDSFGYLGRTGPSNNVVVTDTGSKWSNTTALDVGSSGSFNSLAIRNGGTVSDYDGYLGYDENSENNSALVTDRDSTWISLNTLYVGYSGAFNKLMISNLGVVLADNVYIGWSNSSIGDTIAVGGGNLFVTQSLDVRQGTLFLDSGLVNVGNLSATNFGGGVALSGGTLSSDATLIANHQLFVVGNAVDKATYQLRGGVHSFSDGLKIATNATLAGCGTVIGNVVVDPGGTVLADCGALTFTGPITNNGVMWAINGGVLATTGLLVNNGRIVFNFGGTNFQGGFINNGTVQDAGNTRISSAGLAGQAFKVQIQSAAGLTYQLQSTDALGPTGLWTSLGTPQPGTGSQMTLVDTNGTAAQERFIRVKINLPQR